MRVVTLLLVCFLFLTNFCVAAAPEIKFQDDSYQPTETIIGTINNINSELTRDSLKIYEGRREVSFEKDLEKINGSYYFYIIPPKEGNFSLKLEDVLYNSSAGIASTTIQKDFNVSKKLINNKTQILTIRPGFYTGNNPIINIINSGEESINFSINEFFMSLSAGSSRQISGDLPNGFSFLRIVSYKNFDVPILNYGNSMNISPENYSTNAAKNNYSGCLDIYENMSIDSIVGKNEYYFLSIRNNCSFSLENIEMVPEMDYIKMNDNMLNFTIGGSKSLSFSTDIPGSGVFTSNINFYYANEKLTQTKIIIFSFKNETSLTTFNQTYNSPTKLSCEERNGIFCTQEQSCSSDDYDFYPENPTQTCCFSKCVGLAPPTNWNNIIIGIVGLLLISAVLYILYKMSKKVKTSNPEDKFKELDKKYQKNVIGKKK